MHFSSTTVLLCFVPGSQGEPEARKTPFVPAIGPAGSVIVFNGSVWLGHGANESGQPRRSIQGAYIRREDKPWIDFASRMRPETLARVSPLAKYLLAV